MRGAITAVQSTDYDGYLGPRLSRAEQLRRVRAVFEQELTPCQQRVVQAVYFENRKASDVARELGVNKSTVSRTLLRARARFRRSLRY